MQQPDRRQQLNVPNAIARPRGALGKVGFLEFLRARMAHLTREERIAAWRNAGEAVYFTFDDMRNELDPVGRVTWTALNNEMKGLMTAHAFAILQERSPDVAAVIAQCVDLWPLALCVQTKWTARSSYRR